MGGHPVEDAPECVGDPHGLAVVDDAGNHRRRRQFARQEPGPRQAAQGGFIHPDGSLKVDILLGVAVQVIDGELGPARLEAQPGEGLVDVGV